MEGMAAKMMSTTLIKEVDHDREYSRLRSLAQVIHPFYIKNLPHGAWFSLDAHLSSNWENDNALGWFQEFQLGKMFTKNFRVPLTPGIGIIGDNHDVPDWQVRGGICYLFVWTINWIGLF